MKALDKQAWAAAYNSEFDGFQQQKVFKVVRPEPGVKIHDTLTRLEYKEDNRTRCACAQERISRFWESASKNQISMSPPKSGRGKIIVGTRSGKWFQGNQDRYQASICLYCDMGDDVVYIRPPDCWPEPVPEGHVFLLLKSIYGTRPAARKWHTHISTWMEQSGYSAVNSEKTISMKRKGDEYVIHGLFFDYMMHIYSCDAMKDEFLALRRTSTSLEVPKWKHSWVW
jgi:hypothetical protein